MLFGGGRPGARPARAAHGRRRPHDSTGRGGPRGLAGRRRLGGGLRARRGATPRPTSAATCPGCSPTTRCRPTPTSAPRPGATDPGRLAPSASAPVAGATADPAAVAAPRAAARRSGSRPARRRQRRRRRHRRGAAGPPPTRRRARLGRQAADGGRGAGGAGPRLPHAPRGPSGPGSDELYLVAGGDLLLAAGRGRPRRVVGRAGLGDLAEPGRGRAARAGRDLVRLRLDDTLPRARLGRRRGSRPRRRRLRRPSSWPGWPPSCADAGRPRRETPRGGRRRARRRGSRPWRDRALLAQRTVTRPDGTESSARCASAPLSRRRRLTLAAATTPSPRPWPARSRSAGGPPRLRGRDARCSPSVGRVGVPVDGLVLADGSGLTSGARPARQPDRRAGAGASRSTRGCGRRHRPARRGAHRHAGDRFAVRRRRAARPRPGQDRLAPRQTALAGTVVDADGRLLAFAVLADRIPAPCGRHAARPRRVATGSCAALARCR